MEETYFMLNKSVLEIKAFYLIDDCNVNILIIGL